VTRGSLIQPLAAAALTIEAPALGNRLGCQRRVSRIQRAVIPAESLESSTPCPASWRRLYRCAPIRARISE
jgi:hypothetical protein